MVLSGGAWLITTGGQPLELKPGDVVLIPFGATHGLSHVPSSLQDLPPAVLSEDLSSPGPSDVELLCGAYWLDHGQVHPYLRLLPGVITVSPDYDLNPQLRLLAELLGADLSDAGPGTGATRPALLNLMLTHVLRQWLEQNRLADWPETTDPAIAAALHEIHTNPHRPWTVQSLSATAGMSRTAFTKRFNALMGQPPMSYLTRWRLTYSAQLLRETDVPLATIARRVGYSTEFSFGGVSVGSTASRLDVSVRSSERGAQRND